MFYCGRLKFSPDDTVVVILDTPDQEKAPDFSRARSTMTHSLLLKRCNLSAGYGE
jgi:hypothetical protein